MTSLVKMHSMSAMGVASMVSDPLSALAMTAPDASVQTTDSVKSAKSASAIVTDCPPRTWVTKLSPSASGGNGPAPTSAGPSTSMGKAVPVAAGSDFVTVSENGSSELVNVQVTCRFWGTDTVALAVPDTPLSHSKPSRVHPGTGISSMVIGSSALTSTLT